jgi:exodeoxyribonuclease-5
MADRFQLSVFSFQLSEVARQALDSGILSEATGLRLKIDDLRLKIEDFSIQPNGKDIVRLKGEQVIEQLESSWREVGAEETLIIARSNKMTNLYNNGVRARILWKEDELSNGDRIMVTKNNYFWAQEYDDLEFLANGDMFEVERLYNSHELYGFHFAKAALRSVDYNWEIEALVWLDTLTTDSPEANYQLQKELFGRIAEDYPEIRNKKELIKKIYDSPYYNALQVRFAYCVTCHKAQGGQWKHVYIDSGLTDEWLNGLGETEKREFLRWLYTAVTRATEKIYILR